MSGAALAAALDKAYQGAHEQPENVAELPAARGSAVAQGFPLTRENSL